MTYVQAMKHFFGMLPGQTLMQFSQELISVRDCKDEFIAGLKANGYTIKE